MVGTELVIDHSKRAHEAGGGLFTRTPIHRFELCAAVGMSVVANFAVLSRVLAEIDGTRVTVGRQQGLAGLDAMLQAFVITGATRSE